MPRYWIQDTRGLRSPMSPPIEPLQGLQSLRRDRWEAPMRAQDSTAYTSRRVISDTGMGPSITWRFTSGQPSDSETAELLYSTSQTRLNPGYMPRVQLSYLPAGGVGQTTLPSDAVEAFGALVLEIAWQAADGTTISDSERLDMVASTEPDYGPPTETAASFAALRILEFNLEPPVDLSDPVQLARWCEDTTVTITAYMIGAPRIVDVCTYEIPRGVCFESDQSDWTSHTFAVPDPLAQSGAAGNRPRERKNEVSPDGNPRGGTVQTVNVARTQRERFGPTLIAWSSYQENDASALSGLVPIEASGVSPGLVCMHDTSITAYDGTRAGWQIGVGGYARDYRRNNAQAMGARDAVAVLPVRLRIFAQATGNCSLHLYTGEHSFVTMQVSASAEWREDVGFLEVPITPETQTTAQLFLGGAVDCDVYAVTLEVLPFG